MFSLNQKIIKMRTMSVHLIVILLFENNLIKCWDDQQIYDKP